jgi:hypothetical protein
MNKQPQLADAAKASRDRLPSVGYWFSEDDSFAFGLMVDLSKFSMQQSDSEALFNRFYARLLSEYDRLALQIEAARAERIDPADEPLSISFTHDENIFLQIVPTAIDRATLTEELPVKLNQFVEILEQALEPNHG